MFSLLYKNWPLTCCKTKLRHDKDIFVRATVIDRVKYDDSEMYSFSREVGLRRSVVLLHQLRSATKHDRISLLSSIGLDPVV